VPTSGGTAGSAVQSGSFVITVTMHSVTSSPRNARRPVNISYNKQPNAQMSAPLSTGLPRACSGDMYAAVPRIMPTPVICTGVVIVGDAVSCGLMADAGSIAFAKPKSNTFTVPSSRTLMFAGFRSRWMIPCSWAASRASAICFAIGNASSSGMGPFAIRSATVGPSTSSRINACVLPESSKP
jgi:hypothetical protein